MFQQQCFIGGARAVRARWLAGQIETAALTGAPVLVFYWENEDLPALYRSGASVFAPMYQNSLNIDIFMEFATGYLKAQDFKAAGMLVAETLIPDREIMEVREMYWTQCSRIVIQSLFCVAISRYVEMAEEGKPRAKRPSLFKMMRKMINELLALRGGRKGTLPNWLNPVDKEILPSWWTSADKEIIDQLENILLSNAPQTAGCIISDSVSHLSPLNCMIPEYDAEPFFSVRKEPIFVGLKGLPARAVSLFIEALAANRTEGAVFAADVDLWNERHVSLLVNAYENNKSNLTLTSTTGGGMVPNIGHLLSGNTIWGHSINDFVKNLFWKRVLATTGNDNGRVMNLCYEEPGALPSDNDVICFSAETGWAEMQLDLPSAVNCISAAEEILGERKWSSPEDSPTAGFAELMKRDSLKVETVKIAEGAGPVSDLLTDGPASEKPSNNRSGRKKTTGSSGIKKNSVRGNGSSRKTSQKKTEAEYSPFDEIPEDFEDDLLLSIIDPFEDDEEEEEDQD